MKTLLFLLLSVFSIHAQSVILAWDPVAQNGVTGYNLYWGTASRTYSGTNFVTIPTTQNTVSNLVAGQTYFFAATTKAGTLESDYSTEVTYTVPIAAPSNLRITITLQSASVVTGPWTNQTTVVQLIPTSGQANFYRGLLNLTPNE